MHRSVTRWTSSAVQDARRTAYLALLELPDCTDNRPGVTSPMQSKQ